jgi:hypothetical protein
LRTFREDCATIPRLSFETKKYLRRKPPSRPQSGPPQLRQVISRSVVGPGGASTRTTLYSAPQLGQFASSAGEVSDMSRKLGSECRKEAPKRGSGMYLRYSPPEFCEINITIRRLLLDTLGQQFVHWRHQSHLALYIWRLPLTKLYVTRSASTCRCDGRATMTLTNRRFPPPWSIEATDSRPGSASVNFRWRYLHSNRSKTRAHQAKGGPHGAISDLLHSHWIHAVWFLRSRGVMLERVPDPIVAARCFSI